MSNNTVKFTINIDGNAVKNISALQQETDKLNITAEKTESLFNRIGRACINLNQIYTTLAGSIGGIVNKLNNYEQLTTAQVEAETKLAQVMRNTMGASREEMQSILDLASAQQKLGVIGDEVQLAGAQELGTYLTKADTLKKLMPVMNDMVAQQYGMNASQESAVNIATMMGKVMDGQVGALSRYGYKFDEAQEKILKFGTEEQRAATLAEVVSSAVGGVNEALASTPEGAMKQISNSIGDLQERIGKLWLRLKTSLLPVFDRIYVRLEQLVTWMEGLGTTLRNFGDTINFLSPILLGLLGAIGAVIITVKALVIWETICTTATKLWAGAQAILNAVMTANPIGLVIAGIVALIGVIVFLCVKIKGWGTLWDAVVTFAKETFFMFVEAVKLKYTTMINGIMIGIDKLKEAWYKLKLLLGKGDEIENNRALKEISDDIERRKKAISGGAKEVAKHAQAAANAWKGVSLSFDKSKTLKGVSKDLQASLGLGITDNTKTINNDLSTSSETISAGGKNIKNFNITIGSLIGENTNMFQSSQDSPETAGDFMEKLSMALQMIVNDVNYAAE
ncbi:MAG: hypothetical protein J5606_05950 [Bacteroidales bacterium]|nr:hypothetical protein [Bacteroidales bacterium]